MPESPDRSGRGRGRSRQERPEYTIYRSRPRFLAGLLDRGASRGGDADGLRVDRPERPRRSRLTPRRVAIMVVLGIAGWLMLSLVLFLVSAQIQQGEVSPAAKRALDDGGNIVLSANTILVLGSDARPKDTKEPGANVIGQPSRSDTIMLLRVGGGHSARLSIPRDTIVDIPGVGMQKVNAAYAIGGPQLTIRTLKQYLGIDINHLVEVNFENFPEFIDSLGGIDFTTRRCIRAKINGGAANGGVTIRLKRGTHHLDGKQTLALARIRSNDCNPSENDLTRARRQQQILSAIKSRIVSPGTFFRLPWVSWNAPQAIRSDMGGVTLLGLFADLAVSGSPPTRVLEPSGFQTLPDGGVGIVVDEAEKRREVARFLKR